MPDNKNIGSEKTPSGDVGKTIKATYTAVNPSLFDYKGKEYALYTNGEYELPADCAHVQSLIGQKHLVLIK